MMKSNLRLLCKLTVLSVLGRREELRIAFRKASRQPVSRRAIHEALLQVHLFAGYPAAVEAFRVLHEYPSLRKRNAPYTKASNIRHGMRVFRTVYGDKSHLVLSRINKMSPELAHWMIRDGYGKVLSREGLSLKEREVLAVAALAGLGWERQLQSHIQGCLNTGILEAELREILRMIRQIIPPDSRGKLVRAAYAVFSTQR